MMTILLHALARFAVTAVVLNIIALSFVVPMYYEKLWLSWTLLAVALFLCHLFESYAEKKGVKS